MATLLLRLVGPRQSWGKTRRFDARGTGREPTKAGVLGILATAMGIDRSDWERLEPLARLALAVRCDRPGHPQPDDPQEPAGGLHLADAAFLVGLEGADGGLLADVQAALRDPALPPVLGRPDCPPSEPLWLPDPLHPIQAGSLRQVLGLQPWIATRRDREPIPERLRLSWESTDGTGVRCMDQPLDLFADPPFGARFVHNEWIPFPGEAAGPS